MFQLLHGFKLITEINSHANEVHRLLFALIKGVGDSASICSEIICLQYQLSVTKQHVGGQNSLGPSSDVCGSDLNQI